MGKLISWNKRDKAVSGSSEAMILQILTSYKSRYELKMCFNCTVKSKCLIAKAMKFKYHTHTEKQGAKYSVPQQRRDMYKMYDLYYIENMADCMI